MQQQLDIFEKYLLRYDVLNTNESRIRLIRIVDHTLMEVVIQMGAEMVRTNMARVVVPASRGSAKSTRQGV